MCNPKLLGALSGGARQQQQPAAPAPYSPPMPSTANLDTAQADMGLSPEERALYERHLGNVSGPGGVDHPDGSRSTLYQMSQDGEDGRVYNVPTVWNGVIQTPNTAWQKAMAAGIQKFPSYPTVDAAEARYGKMHGYMERDMDTGQHDRVRTGGQQMGRAP